MSLILIFVFTCHFSYVFWFLFKQAFFPIRKAGHFYVVVFSLNKKLTTITILDNSDSGATYEEKYEDTVELLVSTYFLAKKR